MSSLEARSDCDAALVLAAPGNNRWPHQRTASVDSPGRHRMANSGRGVHRAREDTRLRGSAVGSPKTRFGSTAPERRTSRCRTRRKFSSAPTRWVRSGISVLESYGRFLPSLADDGRRLSSTARHDLALQHRARSGERAILRCSATRCRRASTCSTASETANTCARQCKVVSAAYSAFNQRSNRCSFDVAQSSYQVVLRPPELMSVTTIWAHNTHDATFFFMYTTN